jgi:hypothetical protein
VAGAMEGAMETDSRSRMRAHFTDCSKDAQHAPVHGIACMLRFAPGEQGLRVL